jgi:hypothetical protein
VAARQPKPLPRRCLRELPGQLAWVGWTELFLLLFVSPAGIPAIFAAEIMKPSNDLVRVNLAERLMATNGRPIESKLNAAGIQIAIKRGQQIPGIVLGLEFGRLRLPCPALWIIRPIAHRQPISPALPSILAANLTQHLHFSIRA